MLRTSKGSKFSGAQTPLGAATSSRRACCWAQRHSCAPIAGGFYLLLPAPLSTVRAFRKNLMATPLTKAELDVLVTGLHRVSKNLWWTWDQDAQEVFNALSPRAWTNLYHNAVAILHEVSDQELRARLQDRVLAEKVRCVVTAFDEYLNAKDTWGRQHAAALHQHPVAYFSAEFGFHETLPIAAGGLGVLAGDHSKSASDLDLGFIGLSLFYREGYFMQAIDANNWQTEYYDRLDPALLPVELVRDAAGAPLVCEVDIAMARVKFRAWRVSVGRVPVYLLDADFAENQQLFRDLTLHVYGGDSTTRVLQEMLLGIGGVKLLRALGVQPSVFHMNEGHAAFLALELIREKIVAGGSFADALAATRQECVFTTHTPVEAGHDRFTTELMDYAMHHYRKAFPVPFEEILGLGRVKPADARETFCMTVLALKASRAANAVSALHGEVSRHMWRVLFPGLPEAEVPIGHITNGVHVQGWLKGPTRKFWRWKLNDARGPANGEKFRPRLEAIAAASPIKHHEKWKTLTSSTEFWPLVADHEFITDEEIWALRFSLRRELVEFSRRRLLLQHQRLAHGDFIRFDALLDPDALTIGFARRFATYKRAPLIFQQFEHIVRLARDKGRPVQFIFSGKAHPRDDAGKKFIQEINHLSKFSDLHGHLVFIENYDIHVARTMVAGCDVWLNNPRRPLEASGTSGMKAAANGCLNLSIMDGWWREVCDGANGFAIGDDSHVADVAEQDRVDSENLFRTLTEQVIPTFYERDANGVPRRWVQMIRQAWASITPQFSTARMVQDYTKKYYLAK
jgi:starch phosphorylase